MGGEEWQGVRGGFRGWEAEERKEGSGEITRLGPCEVLQARHGGAEVAATTPKGSAAEERDFYGAVEATDAAWRKLVKTWVPTQLTAALCLIGLGFAWKDKASFKCTVFTDGVMERRLVVVLHVGEISRRFLPEISSSFGVGSLQ